MIRCMQRFLLVLGALPLIAGAAPAYVAVPLGSIGGTTTYGTGINASGQVSGWADTDATGALHRHAFLYSGTIVNLGTHNGGTQSFGYSINDAGQVAGASNAGGVPQLHAVVFSGNTSVDLNALFGGSISNAYAINAAGDLAGAFGAAALSHAYRYRASTNTVTDLGTLGGPLSQAYSINVFGDVTGYAHVLSGDAHAFIYDSRGMVDLGTLGGRTSIGHAINAAGHIAGEASLPADAGPHAFVHDGNAMLDLGTLGGTLSRAWGINSADTVVGETMDAGGAPRAFVYAAGAMIDLNTVTSGLNGATLTIATAINDAGQIVAMSCTGLLVCPQAFRLDPVPAQKVAAIEYHHAIFDHYFVTAIQDEITKLDNGVFAGWSRTGSSFNVYAGEHVGAIPVCRFFSTSFAPKSSHFYTPFAGECATVQRNPDWLFEARVFTIAVPDGNGTCPAATQPVYRLYNNGMGAAPNHRYTTSLATRAQMIAQGWIPEGFGPDAVGMCAPV